MIQRSLQINADKCRGHWFHSPRRQRSAGASWKLWNRLETCVSVRNVRDRADRPARSGAHAESPSSLSSPFAQQRRSHSVPTTFLYSCFSLLLWQHQKIFFFIFPGSTVWLLFGHRREWFNEKESLTPFPLYPESHTAFLVNSPLHLQCFLLWSPRAMSRCMERKQVFPVTSLGTHSFSFFS